MSPFQNALAAVNAAAFSIMEEGDAEFSVEEQRVLVKAVLGAISDPDEHMIRAGKEAYAANDGDMAAAFKEMIAAATSGGY